VRTGNSDEYPKRLEGRLPPGVELKILGERGGWLHVELARGGAGWVPKGRVAEVN
jgi:Bacterial SH3 domain